MIKITNFMSRDRGSRNSCVIYQRTTCCYKGVDFIIHFAWNSIRGTELKLCDSLACFILYGFYQYAHRDAGYVFYIRSHDEICIGGEFELGNLQISKTLCARSHCGRYLVEMVCINSALILNYVVLLRFSHTVTNLKNQRKFPSSIMLEAFLYTREYFVFLSVLYYVEHAHLDVIVH